jgi:hypothetical protein
VAYKQGKIQDGIMERVMQYPNIEENWDHDEVMDLIAEESKSFNFEL